MGAWRILEWSRELGRGAIESPHFPRVEFDAACADVDDFRIGEAVKVEIERSGDTIRVRRVWPDVPRFRAKSSAPGAPALDEALRPDAEEALAQASKWFDARVVLAPDLLRIELDDDGFLYGPCAALDFVDPSYVELPIHLRPRAFRLADGEGRDYAASRVELESSDVVVMILDDEGRYFFVVASRVAFARLR